MKFNPTKGLMKAGMVAAGVVAAGYAGDMLVSKVAYLQENPTAANVGMVVLGAMLPELVPGGKGTKDLVEAIGIGFIAKGATGLAATYLPAIEGVGYTQYRAIEGGENQNAVAGDVNQNVVA